MLFIDPEKPMATCDAKDCSGCSVENDLHCHFRPRDLIHFLLISIPPFLLGGAGIMAVSGWWLIVWLLIIIAFFGFIEIRVMCSHCPHYAERPTSLKCWANYGAPKLWKYRPGPMKIMEKVVFFTGFAAVWGYPLLFVIPGRRLFLLLVYLMTTAGFFMTLKHFLCSQCINFACPLNSVDQPVREKFFISNPAVGRAWKNEKD